VNLKELRAEEGEQMKLLLEGVELVSSLNVEIDLFFSSVH
jgi:hypothetical protein